MDHEPLLSDTHWNPLGGILPPPYPLLVTHKQRLAVLRIACSPPSLNAATARLHTSFPSLSAYEAQDSSRALTKGLTTVYLPNWKTPRSVPPIRNHLLVDAVAHRTIPFTHGLSRIPIINSHLVSPALATLPQSLMDNMYSALKKRIRRALRNEWACLFATPGGYHHLFAVNPGPFMSMNKVMAGRIHQMRPGKSYLATHPT